MLSKLKTAMGLSSLPERDRGTETERETERETDCLTATFTEESLGLSLGASSQHDGRAVVAAVLEDSPAHRAGVRPGMLLAQVNGSNIDSFDAFLAIQSNLGRPLTIKYRGIVFFDVLTS